VRNGKLDMLERQRTRSRALARVIELTGQALGGKRPERMGIIHVNVPDEARQFSAQVRAALPCPENILIAELTPGLSVHSGAGMIGLVVVTAV
jgi:fatty acid-binding protein DegV